MSDDVIMNLCETLLDNNFNTDNFAVNFKEGTCVISSMNSATTALIKIKINTNNLDTDFKDQNGIIHTMDLNQKMYSISPFDNKFEETHARLLDHFEEKLFDSKGYKMYPFELFMKKLNCRYNDKSTVLIDCSTNESVIDTYYVKTCIIGNPNVVFVKLLDNMDDTPLCLNYQFRAFNVYCVIAPKIVAHDCCNIVKVM